MGAVAGLPKCHRQRSGTVTEASNRTLHSLALLAACKFEHYHNLIFAAGVLVYWRTILQRRDAPYGWAELVD
jgi:hypothetical protein